ncbi:hypothetical protein BcepF1.013 [Burkholderia phage BcepF1]|uniref:Uncharacterized protein n=1 Tax=Burkholderia phage BcepF1 TaxID=2886897 RepID=A1YZR7_9CAUD|nr:hypothetical protein BcepF1.013 [Burkholderia phage BcepF1]ABL96744.1 hypothetical protein BcepF1.013 [Burkholderia phage BcepF1]
MVRVTVRQNFVEKDPIVFCQHPDEHIALKCVAAGFAAHCAKSGMRLDVHSEFVVDMLRQDFGYHVSIETDH